MIKSFSFSYNHHLPSTTRRTFQILFFDCGGPSGCLSSPSGIHEKKVPTGCQGPNPENATSFHFCRLSFLLGGLLFLSRGLFFCLCGQSFHICAGSLLGPSTPWRGYKKKKPPTLDMFVCPKIYRNS